MPMHISKKLIGFILHKLDFRFNLYLLSHQILYIQSFFKKHSYSNIEHYTIHFITNNHDEHHDFINFHEHDQPSSEFLFFEMTCAYNILTYKNHLKG